MQMDDSLGRSKAVTIRGETFVVIILRHSCNHALEMVQYLTC